MTLQLAVQVGNIEGINTIRERLGDSGNVRGAVTPVLRQGARVGTEAARLHAPRGSTGRLAGAIADDAIVFRIRAVGRVCIRSTCTRGLDSMGGYIA
jgi:hypothetical protein